ncbi:MAG: pimeloyl-ACP methyl ester esterase BioH [Rudaea sp.]
MHIETTGTGPDLVLIHGWAMHSGVFAPLTRELKSQFRLHLVDLPGHGASNRDTAACDPASCAAAIAAMTPRALWVGWSLGGIVTLQAALNHSAQVRALVEIATPPRFVASPEWPRGVSRDVFTQFARGLKQDYRNTIERFLALETMGSDHARSELRDLKSHVFDRGEPSPDALELGLHALGTIDLRARLADLHVPSLWVAGGRDRLVSAGALRWAAKQSPQGRFMEFPTGHAPFISHGKEVAAAISAFAQEIAA